eukprot:GGOE01012010.1.p1 GENE.GGOE01012010.1~~GGOE01012010.1.p1  ORF type:complete len:354 (-),score=-23.88 GGOE01012010.1:749-1810(-)
MPSMAEHSFPNQGLPSFPHPFCLYVDNQSCAATALPALLHTLPHRAHERRAGFASTSMACMSPIPVALPPHSLPFHSLPPFPIARSHPPPGNFDINILGQPGQLFSSPLAISLPISLLREATLVLRCQWHQPCALCPPPYPPPRLCFSCARQESARCRFPPCAPWRVTSAQLPPHCSRSPSDPLIRLPLSASLRQCWRCGVTGFLCSMGVALPRGPPKTLPLTSKKLNLQPHRQSDVVLPSPSPCVMHRQWHTGAPPPISSLCPSAWADCLGSRRLLRFPSAPSVWMEPLRPGRPFPQDCCGKSHGTKVDPPDTLHMAGAYALCDAQDAPPSALVRMPRVWHCVTHVHVCHVN